MSQEKGFNRLEETVQKLLENYSLLKASKEELEKKILEKDQQIGELNSKISMLQSERGDISGRVDALLRQIDEWEDLADEVTVVYDDDQMEAEDTSDGESVDADLIDSRQGKLFSVEP